MEVILLERMQNLGDLGDQVTVKPGYARNYLIPQRKAMPATEAAKAKVEERRQELLKQEAARVASARQRAEGAVRAVTITRRASEEGKLFGSVSPADIAEAAAAAGTEIARSEIQLPEGPLKEVGEFEVEVILHPEVRFALQVSVVAEE